MADTDRVSFSTGKGDSDSGDTDLKRKASAGEDILDYIFHVYQVKLAKEEKKYGITYDWEGGTDVMIKPSKGSLTCTKQDVDMAYDNFVTFVQRIHSNLTSKDVDLRSGDIPSAIIKFARKDTHTKYPKVMIKELQNEKQLRVLGEVDDVKDAMETYCSYLGVPVPTSRHAGKKRHGRPTAVQRSNSHSGGTMLPVDVHLEFSAGLESKTSVTICKGDITKLQIDAIVNAANSQLNHGGGVAGAISLAGGYSIQEDSYQIIKNRGGKPLSLSETVYTKAGNLPCQWVLHTVGPDTRKGGGGGGGGQGYGVKNALINCCRQILSLANSLNIKSVAVPAIGTGVYGVPKHLCAEMMRDAVFEYFENRQPSHSVQEIYFIDVDNKTVETFASVFEKSLQAHRIPYNSKKVKVKESSVDGRYYGGHHGAHGQTADSNQSGFSSVGGVKQLTHMFAGDSNFSAASSSAPLIRATTTNPQSSPAATGSGSGADNDCSICLDTIDDPKTLPCKHTFCKGCIDQSEKIRGPSCPLCKEPYGVIYGDMPKGTMTEKVERYLDLPGYDKIGCIKITYNIPPGIQKEGHPNPGARYHGDRRTAYLPNSREGLEVLHLLKIAFDRKLTFTIGTSRTTGASDVITWNDIHHKTSMFGGPQGFGYPDPSYLARVKDELAAKGVK